MFILISDVFVAVARRRCVNSLFLPHPEHVHREQARGIVLAPTTIMSGKKGTESEHSRKFLAMEHLGKRTAGQMDYSTEPKRV